MKKSVVASLAAAMVLGLAGTSFAAVNPFVDVPTNHWSYTAVSDLAKAGIVDGYGDGTFRGDKTMSRYEMAQITAKAMAHSDKADAKQKAEIDKLAVEFADELEGLNVRVTKLEKGASSIKFSGDARVRWNNTDSKVDGQQWKDRFRLNMTSNVNAKTSLYARFIFSDDSFNQDSSQHLSDLAFTTKGLFPSTDVTLGRYSLRMGPIGALADTTGDVEGIMTKTTSGNAGLLLGYGQARNTAPSLVTNKILIKNIAFAEGTEKLGKVKLSVDYFKNLDAGKSDGNKGIVADAYQIVGGGLSYAPTSNFKLDSEYFVNKAGAAKYYGSDPKATIIRASYKGVNAANPGSWGMYVENNKFEGNVLPYCMDGPSTKENYDSVGILTPDGLKSWAVSGSYAVAKNVTFDTFYQFKIKNTKTGADAPSTSFSRAQVNYMF